MTVVERIEKCEAELKDRFAYHEKIAEYNQEKIIKAFQKHEIALRHFNGTTGYGYGDDGRYVLGDVFADVFKTEAGIVSPALLSGTHALSVSIFGLARPGDVVLCLSGTPYDTMRGVVYGTDNGSLKDYGIDFFEVPLTIENKFDFQAFEKKYSEYRERVKVVYIQRSRGYELRDAFSVEEIGEACEKIRSLGFDGCIFVDNCYGELVQTSEPTEVGVDVCVGSLIKNIGGGLAPTGGYIVGKKKYVDRIGNRLTAPSVGNEVGSYAYGYRLFYQGLFMSAHTVFQAIKGSLLIGKAMQEMGYENYPSIEKTPYDITRAIRFPNREKLCSFIQSVQTASPVDSFVKLEPWDMPGYEEKVIMAAGTFVEGASIELSADAPIREPYTAYFQGGLTYEHTKYCLKMILEGLENENV